MIMRKCIPNSAAFIAATLAAFTPSTAPELSKASFVVEDGLAPVEFHYSMLRLNIEKYDSKREYRSKKIN